MKPSSKALLAVLSSSALLLAGCDRREAPASGERPRSLPSPSKLEVGTDGLTRLKGQTDPYTGGVLIVGEDGKLRYSAYYQGGKLHGAELKFYDDGKIRRQFDYHLGEKIHHREWFPNGNRKIDAEMRNGVGFGSHRTWFEDGSTRWAGRFGENLRWEGHIVDYAADGKLMWDAVFQDGQFVSGTYPEAEQEQLIRAGRVKPEAALYPRKETAAPAPPANPGPPVAPAVPAVPEAPAAPK